MLNPSNQAICPPKLPENNGTVNGGKRNHILGEDGHSSSNEESYSSSYSNTNDHCLKRAKKTENSLSIASQFSDHDDCPVFFKKSIKYSEQQQHSSRSLTNRDDSRPKNSKVPTMDKVVAKSSPLVINQNPRQDQLNTCIDVSETSNSWAYDVISSIRREAALAMWKVVQQKITCTPFEKVALLEQEVGQIFQAISKIEVSNSTSLQESVNGYLWKVEKFNNLRSLLSSQLTSASKNRQLGKLKFDLEILLSDNYRILEEKSTLEQRSAEVLEEIMELEAKLEAREAKHERLSKLIIENEENLNRQCIKVSKAREEIRMVERAPTLSDVDIKSLELHRQMLENAQKELKDFEWIPQM